MITKMVGVCGASSDAQRQIEESPSFLKKRSKRLLFFRRSYDRGHGRDLSARAGTKVFLLLFLQKKKILPTEFRCAARTPTLWLISTPQSCCQGVKRR